MDWQSVLYLLLWAALFFVMMRFGCGAHVLGHGAHHGNERREGARRTAPSRATDPVCGMAVDPQSAKSAVHDSQVFYFCSADCRDKFEANPAAYGGTTNAPSHQIEEKHHGCC